MADAIDFSQAVMAAPDCPDIRGWAIGSQISRVDLAATERYERGNVMVEFAGRDSLPATVPLGSQGDIRWTLWGGFDPGGRGTILFAPLVECIRTYIPTGFLFAPNQVGSNLLYYSMDVRLQGYQPRPGERIYLVVTTGDTRRQNVQAPGVTWRTNVVAVPFMVQDTTFPTGPVPVPQPPTPTPQPPTPVPTPPSSTLEQQVRELSATVEALVLEVARQEALNQAAFADADRRLREQEARVIPTKTKEGRAVIFGRTIGTVPSVGLD